MRRGPGEVDLDLADAIHVEGIEDDVAAVGAAKTAEEAAKGSNGSKGDRA